MTTELICPNGHFWEMTIQTMVEGESTPTACPICGQNCTNQNTTLDFQPNVTQIIAGNEIRPSPFENGLANVQETTMPNVPGYAIVGLLGQGGMGTVYKARHLRLGRLVALKMISSEQTSLQRMRFQSEGEALAKLDHPNIVRIFEIGECNGSPYFSLEYLEGGSLDKKLTKMPQTPASTAQTIETLARAIHFAHQHGIMHRDLKPGNIMLGKNGQPKIGDFGLAKQFEKEITHTRTGDILGTPTYMAPEQATGDSKVIGPLSDVYALGVIFYEMLTGRPPFRGINTLETLKMICSKDPVSPRQLQPSIPRDLETICLKCMEKSPTRRYGSAADLAEDLLRFQSHRPILARRANIGERLGKWVRRHPFPAALVGVIFLAILTIGVLSVWSNASLRFFAKKADMRSRMARSVVDDLYSQFAEEWLAEEPHKDPVRQKFLEQALRLYQEFAEESRADPDMRCETARAHFRLGQIHRILNQHEKAQSAYQQAIFIQEDLCIQYPTVLQYPQDLGNSRNWLGELLHQLGKLEAAEDSLRKANEIQENLLNGARQNQGYRNEIARSNYNLAIVLMDTNRPQEAEGNLTKAFSLLEGLHGEFPEVADYRHEWARCFINRGVLNKGNRFFLQAEKDYQQAIELLRPLVAAFSKKEESIQGPFRAVYRTDLAVAHRNLGNLLWSQNRFADALRELTQAMEILKRLVTDFPNRPAYQKKLADTYNSLGSVASSFKNFTDGENHYREARDLFNNLVQEHPDVIEYQQLLAIAIGNLGWVRSEHQDWPGARKHYEQAIIHLTKARDANPKNPDCLRALGNQYQSLTETTIRLGDHAAATEAAKALSEVNQNRAQDCYYAACFLSRCIRLVEIDPQISDASSRQSCAQKYASLALTMMQKATEAGIVSRVPNEEEIFKPLLDMPGFKKLLTTLNGKAKP